MPAGLKNPGVFPRPTALELFGKKHPAVRMGLKVLSRVPISSSAISTWNECRRKFFWRYSLGLVSKGVLPPKALLTGTLLHEAMREITLRASADGMTRHVVKLAEEALQETKDHSGVVPVGAIELVAECREKALAMAVGFKAAMERSQLGYLDGNTWEVLGVELELTGELPYTGKRRTDMTMDLLIRNRETQKCRVIDYKSCTDSALDVALAQRMSLQPRLYAAAAKIWLGHDIESFVHFVVQKPTIRQKKPSKSNPTGETQSEYLDRCIAWYNEKSNENPNSPPIVKADTPVTGEMDAEMFHAILEYRKGASGVSTAKFWRSGAPYACFKFGKRCAYWDLCQSDPVTWTETIFGRFKQEFRYEKKEVPGD